MKRKVLVALMLLACVFVSQTMALTPGRVTMLVVPARYSVMQVAFDLAQRYTVVLVSYQGDASSESPLLHAWNGKEWVKITMEEYSSASFLQVTPGEALLIGDETMLPPVLASSIAGWCPKVTTLPSIDTATLVNSFAKEFSFRKGDWEWFAKRYNLTLNDQNAEVRKSSWYDQPAYEDKYTEKVQNWFGLKKSGQASGNIVAPAAVEPEPVPETAAPVEAPVQSEPLPPGADADMSAPQPGAGDAAFTSSPMPEEDARNALQAPPPVSADAANAPAFTAPAQPIAVPAPGDQQPVEAGAAAQ